MGEQHSPKYKKGKCYESPSGSSSYQSKFSSSKFKNVQQQEGSEVIGELTPHPQFVELKQTHMASHQRATTCQQPPNYNKNKPKKPDLYIYGMKHIKN